MTLEFTVVTVAKPFGFTTQQINTSALERSKAMIQQAGPNHKSYHAIVSFANGYEASVISNNDHHGSLFELAVTHGGRLCYLTPVTDNVVPNLDFEEVSKYLFTISTLPSNAECLHERKESE